jgi:hypothetical protein
MVTHAATWADIFIVSFVFSAPRKTKYRTSSAGPAKSTEVNTARSISLARGEVRHGGRPELVETWRDTAPPNMFLRVKLFTYITARKKNSTTVLHGSEKNKSRGNSSSHRFFVIVMHNPLAERIQSLECLDIHGNIIIHARFMVLFGGPVG